MNLCWLKWEGCLALRFYPPELENISPMLFAEAGARAHTCRNPLRMCVCEWVLCLWKIHPIAMCTSASPRKCRTKALDFRFCADAWAPPATNVACLANVHQWRSLVRVVPKALKTPPHTQTHRLSTHFYVCVATTRVENYFIRFFSFLLYFEVRGCCLPFCAAHAMWIFVRRCMKTYS